MSSGRRGMASARGRSSSARLLAASVAVAAGMAPVIMVVSGAAAATVDAYVEDKAGVTVDWRRGVVAATGGAAADHRMPSADVARAGAERRARAAARVRLTETLRVLPLGGGRHLDESAVSRAVGRARVANVEYQSNGGALVRLEIAFGDWMDAAAAGQAMLDTPVAANPVSVVVSECRLGAAPVLIIGGKEIVLGGAHYQPIASLPAGTNAVSAHFDKKGRLVLADSENPPELAGRLALIYVRKLLR